ncbi:MAG: cysteine-rich CWC family protein [Pseudomonadota bacterium]
MTAPGAPQDAGLQDTSTCPRCGAGLRCGMVANDSKCWCFEMPHVIPVPPTSGNDGALQAGCLCPACLQKLIEEKA